MMEASHAVAGSLALDSGGRLDPRVSRLTARDRARSRFAAAMDFIEENLDREISLFELASLVALSVSHFAHAFKAEFGLSPYRYIIVRRIDRAKTLLRSTDDTVAAIAQCVGFSSQAHFSEHFAKIAGVTPSAYRRAGSGGETSPRSMELQHGGIVQASAQLRNLAKRLWWSSTIDEALAVAAEESAQHFGDASLVFSIRRVAAGHWNPQYVLDRGIAMRNEELFQELASSLPPEGFDEIGLYPALSNPGDVGTRDSFRLTSVAQIYEAAVAAHNLHRSTFLHARVCSRSGVTAGITVKHASERLYSDVDREVISAIASLTSLALS